MLSAMREQPGENRRRSANASVALVFNNWLLRRGIAKHLPRVRDRHAIRAVANVRPNLHSRADMFELVGSMMRLLDTALSESNDYMFTACGGSFACWLLGDDVDYEDVHLYAVRRPFTATATAKRIRELLRDRIDPDWRDPEDAVRDRTKDRFTYTLGYFPGATICRVRVPHLGIILRIVHAIGCNISMENIWDPMPVTARLARVWARLSRNSLKGIFVACRGDGWIRKGCTYDEWTDDEIDNETVVDAPIGDGAKKYDRCIQEGEPLSFDDDETSEDRCARRINGTLPLTSMRRSLMRLMATVERLESSVHNFDFLAPGVNNAVFAFVAPTDDYYDYYDNKSAQVCFARANLAIKRVDEFDEVRYDAVNALHVLYDRSFHDDAYISRAAWRNWCHTARCYCVDRHTSTSISPSCRLFSSFEQQEQRMQRQRSQQRSTDAGIASVTTTASAILPMTEYTCDDRVCDLRGTTAEQRSVLRRVRCCCHLDQPFNCARYPVRTVQRALRNAEVYSVWDV